MPSVPEAFALALQFLRAGDARQTEAICRQIVQVDPAHADSHHLLGVLASQNIATLDDAIMHFRRALHFRPEFAEAYSNLGNAYFMKQYLAEAIAQYRQALRLRPDYLEAHNNIGLALAGTGELDQAMWHYRRALQLNPNSPETYSNLGSLHLEQRQFPEAVACFQQALRLQPDFAKAHHNLGVAYERQGKIDEAVRCHWQAIQLQPTSPEIYCSLGLALEQQDKFDEAIQCYRKAIELQPSCVEAHNGLGTALQRQSRLDEALTHYSEAVRHKPDNAMAHWNRAILWLALGNYEQGWPEYEWRWTQPGYTPRQFPQPVWDGSDLSGRTILVHAEQGLGDQFQFVRYAPILKRLGAKVIFACHCHLARLLGSVPGIDQIVSEDSALPAFDLHLPMFSLPAVMHTTLHTIPNQVPYLFADADLVEKWRQVLRPANDKPAFLIGICWQGSPTHSYNHVRSIPLEMFGQLAAVPGIRLVSLQRQWRSGSASDRTDAVSDPSFDLLDFGDELDSTAGGFMDTAAIMKNLDLVITCDTAVAHLAGALGVPVWVALAQVPDWRWLLQREDSPWYPTMRLFRQTRSGDWDSVFARIAAELRRTVLPDS